MGQAPEEASLVHDVVLLHHPPPVPLQLLDPPLLRLRCLDVTLLQVPGGQATQAAVRGAALRRPPTARVPPPTACSSGTDLWSGRSRVSVDGSVRFSSAVSSFSSKANWVKPKLRSWSGGIESGGGEALGPVGCHGCRTLPRPPSRPAYWVSRCTGHLAGGPGTGLGATSRTGGGARGHCGSARRPAPRAHWSSSTWPRTGKLASARVPGGPPPSWPQRQTPLGWDAGQAVPTLQKVILQWQELSRVFRISTSP